MSSTSFRSRIFSSSLLMGLHRLELQHRIYSSSTGLCSIRLVSIDVQYISNSLVRVVHSLCRKLSELFMTSLARKAITCQTERCLEKRNIASKVCVNILLSIHGHDTPPPLYMCTDCFKNSSKEIQAYSRNIVCPISEIDLRCQNKVHSFSTLMNGLSHSPFSNVFRRRRTRTSFAIPLNVANRMAIIQ